MNVWETFVYGNDLSKNGYTVLKDNKRLSEETKDKIISLCEAFGEYLSFENSEIGEAISILYKKIDKWYVVIRVKYIGKDFNGRDGALKFESLLLPEEILEKVDYNIFTLLRLNKDIFEKENKDIVLSKIGNSFIKTMSEEIAVRDTDVNDDPKFKVYAQALEKILNNEKSFIPEKINFEYLLFLLPINVRKRLSIATYLEKENDFFDVAYVLKSFDEDIPIINPRISKIHDFLLQCKKRNVNNCLYWYKNLFQKEHQFSKSSKKSFKTSLDKKKFYILSLIVVSVLIIVSILTFSHILSPQIDQQKLLILTEYKNLLNKGDLKNIDFIINDFEDYIHSHKNDKEIDNKLNKLKEIKKMYDSVQREQEKMYKTKDFKKYRSLIMTKIKDIEKYGLFKQTIQIKETLIQKEKLYLEITNANLSLQQKINEAETMIKKIKSVLGIEKNIEREREIYEDFLTTPPTNCENIQKLLDEINEYRQNFKVVDLNDIKVVIEDRKNAINRFSNFYDKNLKDNFSKILDNINKFEKDFFLPEDLIKIKNKIQKIENDYLEMKVRAR